MWCIREGLPHTFFAAPVCFYMICFLLLPVTLWCCTRKFVRIWKYDVLSSTRLYQAMVYCFCHWRWPGIFAFHNVLPCKLLECPHERFWWRTAEIFRGWVHAIAMHRNDNEIVLFLRLLWHWQTKDLFNIFPCHRKFNIPTGSNGPYTAVLSIE